MFQFSTSSFDAMQESLSQFILNSCIDVKNSKQTQTRCKSKSYYIHCMLINLLYSRFLLAFFYWWGPFLFKLNKIQSMIFELIWSLNIVWEGKIFYQKLTRLLSQAINWERRYLDIFAAIKLREKTDLNWFYFKQFIIYLELWN